MSGSPWPNSAKAAISFTFDNLGEAQEINADIWPSHVPVGHHFSIKTLPRMLQILAESNVKATFFFESWSSTVYPEVIRDVVGRGHEIGWHGFQHETWSKLSPKEEEDNFKRSFAEADKLKITYSGFLPPGGLINESTYDLLHKYGIRYISPAAEKVAVVRNLAVLPFHWKTVDAFFYMEEFSGLRQFYGAPKDALSPTKLKEQVLEQVEEAVRSNGYISLLFHPVLQTSEEKLSVMREVVEHVANDPRIWCAPCNQIADWVMDHQDSFGSEPSWIKATW